MTIEVEMIYTPDPECMDCEGTGTIIGATYGGRTEELQCSCVEETEPVQALVNASYRILMIFEHAAREAQATGEASLEFSAMHVQALHTALYALKRDYSFPLDDESGHHHTRGGDL